jgi:hypothetical protein
MEKHLTSISNPEDGGVMFLRNFGSHELYGVISQTIELFLRAMNLLEG